MHILQYFGSILNLTDCLLQKYRSVNPLSPRTFKPYLLYLYSNYVPEFKFAFETVLSEPDDSWQGNRGHVTPALVKSALDNICLDSHLFHVDVFPLVCGPTVFTNFSRSLLEDMGYKKDQMYIFVG